jgi:hypothetical protein
VKKVIVYYIDITSEDEIRKFIRDDDSTTVEIELRDLKTVLDDVVIGDYAEFHTEERTDDLRGGWRVTVDKFLSDRVIGKIQEYNWKGQLNAGKKGFKPIEISDEGLELIEFLSLDCTAAAGEWHSDSEIKIDKLGYVIRNGVLYRNTSSGSEDLVIYADGTFRIISEDDITAEELLASGARNVLSFGPALVENGEIAVTEKEEVGRAMASNPRTAIGTLENGHYLFVVADGRTSESDGLSLHELAAFLQSLGAQTAYNLDGGGSSSMVFLGNIVNNPANGKNRSSERSVSDIVYIGYGT